MDDPNMLPPSLPADAADAAVASVSVNSPVTPPALPETVPATQEPPAAAPESSAPSIPASRPLRQRLARYGRVGTWVLLAGLCVALLFWARSFGTRVVEARPVNARIEITNPPAWLDQRIVQALLQEAYQFAGRDTATYDRTRNILDAGILKEFANVYTGTDTTGSKSTPRQSIGYNAWISKITQVRRAVAQDNGMQSIQITAQWRQPAAWIRAQQDGATALFLIDNQGTRLPGIYHLADRAGNNPLMVIAGVDLPAGGIPAPGEKWFTKSEARAGAAMGDDLAAGMSLIGMLSRQKFTAQIAAIDVSNFGGRQDALASWIKLETIWPGSSGSPRYVAWGRPPGQEKYYEVQAAAKLSALRNLYTKFGRIDANRDFVDIRTDYIRAPKLAVQPAEAPSTRS